MLQPINQRPNIQNAKKTTNVKKGTKTANAKSILGTNFSGSLSEEQQSQAIEQINSNINMIQSTGSSENIGQVGDISAILALSPIHQESHNEESKEQRRERILQWNKKALLQLEHLQYDILNGNIDLTQLYAIKKELQYYHKENKNLHHEAPKLKLLLNDIDTRVRVEIAKRARFEK